MAANNDLTTEVLAGLVERVTFHNEDNGFCVLRVKARGKREPITVVGHAAVISAGEFIQASGEWANDRTHGVQFRARFLKTVPPTTTEGIEKYLGSGMIRGVGLLMPANSSGPSAAKCSTSSRQSRIGCGKLPALVRSAPMGSPRVGPSSGPSARS